MHKLSKKNAQTSIPLAKTHPCIFDVRSRMRVPFLSNQQFPVAVFLRKFEKLRARYKKAKLKEWGVYVRMKHYAVVLLVITICTLGTITLSHAWWAPADVNQDFKVDMDDVNLCRDAWKSNSSDLHWTHAVTL